MVRTRVVLAGVVVAALLGAGVMATSASAATLELRKTAKGELVTDSSGFTLFQFSLDMKNVNHCVAIVECPGVWPAATVTGTPTVGPGLDAKRVGTITLANGTKQVTYKHHALYEYIGDLHPEETFYLNAFAFGGYWRGMNAKGGKVR
jgi:predicted lipoprotein with Yx(FWY)xxD motif